MARPTKPRLWYTAWGAALGAAGGAFQQIAETSLINPAQMFGSAIFGGVIGSAVGWWCHNNPPAR